MKAFCAIACSALILGCPAAEAAEPQPSWFPKNDPSCSTEVAPADAGAVVTPGGFMLVHPRNDRLKAYYNGCKTLWIVDEDPDAPRRWATLQFEQGRLRRAVLWQREAPDIADRVCDPPGFETQAAPHAQPPCSGVEDNELVALRLASWPRACMIDPDREECREDPK